MTQYDTWPAVYKPYSIMKDVPSGGSRKGRFCSEEKQELVSTMLANSRIRAHFRSKSLEGLPGANRDTCDQHEKLMAKSDQELGSTLKKTTSCQQIAMCTPSVEPSIRDRSVEKDTVPMTNRSSRVTPLEMVQDDTWVDVYKHFADEKIACLRRWKECSKPCKYLRSKSMPGSYSFTESTSLLRIDFGMEVPMEGDVLARETTNVPVEKSDIRKVSVPRRKQIGEDGQCLDIVSEKSEIMNVKIFSDTQLANEKKVTSTKHILARRSERRKIRSEGTMGKVQNMVRKYESLHLSRNSTSEGLKDSRVLLDYPRKDVRFVDEIVLQNFPTVLDKAVTEMRAMSQAKMRPSGSGKISSVADYGTFRGGEIRKLSYLLELDDEECSCDEEEGCKIYRLLLREYFHRVIYSNGKPTNIDLFNKIGSSPDISINRENLAKGSFLLAAREVVIQHHMSKKESEYTNTQTFRIFAGTWNVNNKLPTVSLQDWLACDIEPPDIYAVAFQELDLSTAAFVRSDRSREDEWRFQVEKGLHQGAEYKKVESVRMVGLLLMVYIKKNHLNHVKRVRKSVKVGTGLLNIMGNKGGVSIRMEIHNTSICFVNSHLAAHVVECERRNQDFKDICRRTTFSGFSPPLAIRDHDHIYWLGDLNYRIIPGIDVEVVKDYLARKNFKPILEYDQLNYQRRKENVFKDFKEGPIDFMPTYKYDVGTDNWDSSGKERAPAWCDRILWKGDSITQLEYRSHQDYRISDHKPVSAVFLADIKKVDIVKWRKIHEEVTQKLDKLENEFLPQVTVDTTEIVYDPINFLESQTRYLTIANNGQVPVKFEFVKKLEDVSYCKDWLTIDPYTSDVHPGETCTIRLKVLVDKKSAFKLNAGDDQLSDILVLHFVGGRHIFITVTEPMST